MIELADHPEGLLVPVRAQPGARGIGIRGEHAGMLKLAVSQVAEKGKANKALAEALAKGLGLKRSQVELESGQTQREKKFLVRGIARDELAERIAAAIAAAC
jgi:uncharacterized protein (TIGR00251 family)